jgi:predicted dehydrogenase
MLADHPGSVGFESLDEMLAHPPVGLAAVIIASPDQAHADAAVRSMDAGLHVLIEKPIAHTMAGVSAIAARAGATDRVVAVAHVLRYTPFFQTLKGVIASGRLGDLVHVDHRENVVAWHMAHSFVRGNWGKAADSSPMIVAKCCHDFDILAWNLDSPVVSLTSVGSLFEFRAERAPDGATERCTSPCPVSGCPYDARNVYLNPRNTGWPVHVITDDLSQEGRLAALATGPYGLCAYAVGSDVVDHQVVSMELASGATATLTMHGHSHEEQRTMRYDGTRATLRATFGSKQEIELIDHATGRKEIVSLELASGGHGGGDNGLLGSFVAAIREQALTATSPADALEAYTLAFAAEEARLSGRRKQVREVSA